MSIKVSKLQGGEEQILSVMAEVAPLMVFAPDEKDQFPDYVRNLIGALKAGSDSLLVITAYRDKELLGFMIAHTRPSHVWLAQSWVKEGTPWKVTDAMAARVMLWAVALGKPSIRAETQRDVSALHRRFGFEERSVTVERKFTKAMIESFILKASEVLNG